MFAAVMRETRRQYRWKGHYLMTRIGSINLKVMVVDSDFYARNAINAYLAWDRRTRVIGKVDALESFWAGYQANLLDQAPDAIILDANHLGGAQQLQAAIKRLRATFEDLVVLCLAQFADHNLIQAAAEAGARAYLLKQDVQIHIAWALCHACALNDDEFLISKSLRPVKENSSDLRLRQARQLAGPRHYPDLTNRTREAIVLFAVEGMPQRLVAHEMGIHESTVRSYIKRAYTILETWHNDENDYPPEMNRQEIAFMRLTALDLIDR